MILLERLKNESLPQTLFHYTDSKGLLGILDSNCLWATSARYLNDSYEYSYGLKLIANTLTEAAVSTSSLSEQARLDGILSSLSEFPGVCVASLTEDSDILSQWRAYGGNSGGFALGLGAEYLRARAHQQGFYLVKCIYSAEDQRNAVRELILEFSGRMASSSKWDPQDSGGCAASATRLALMLKHESFRQECEWRLMSIPKSVSELEYRQGASTLVPYFKFDLGSDRNAYLHSVTVGPTPHPDLASTSVQMLLRKLKLSDPEAKVSTTVTPYRNW